jgi:internalin A
LSLRALRELNLGECRAGGSLAVLRPIFEQLEKLFLHESHWSDFDDTLCGGFGENVLEAVCSHFRDLDQEASEDVEVRVLVLGNGGAGKTQLTRRLRGLDFDPQVASTHGIELHEVRLGEFALNLWDFGGQEIYHGAHSLFVQGRAVFLVLWTPRLETVGAYQENGLTMRHRPLHYWLDYLRAYAGTDYPVIVVQSQCDAPEDRVHSLPLDGFSSIQPTQVSAKNGLGLGALQGMLQDAVRIALQRRPGVKTGAGRIRLRERIREIRSQHRLLARADFDALCDEVGGILSKDAALDYLHHCGVVFYRKELFRGEIVLDQNWALEAIYALFDRKKILPLLRGYGRFRREELEALIWQKYSEAEQKVFLGMMESCGICFAIGDDEYIAPELLPERSEAQEKLLAGRISAATPDAEQVFAYGFLHEGLLRNFLSKIGEQAKDAAVYWKYGCWFYERNTGSSVLVESEWEESAKQFGAGKIRFRAWGGQADELVAALQQELERMPLGQKAELQLRRPIDEDTLALKDLSAEVVVQSDGGQKKVYVSYAWGKEESEQQKVVDGLRQSLQREGWQVMRDTEQLKYGDLLSDYMKMLAQGDRIIVVLSEKYLKSVACMTELYGIYQRASGEKKEFLKHVVPLRLDDAKISSDEDQLAIVDYWQGEVKRLKPRLEKLGEDRFRRFKLMQSLVISVSDMLSAISDTWHPKGFETIVKNDFEGLKRLLGGQ